jgi:hypothetical protein
MIYHVEVHSRDRQVEHYIVPNSESEADALQKIRQFYADKGQRIGLWDKESDRLDIRIPFLIFDCRKLEGEPVLYVAGEYRTQYPI